MEENLKNLIDFYHNNESEKFEGIDSLKLICKYLVPLGPNPKNARIFYRNLKNPLVPCRASICFIHGFGENSAKHLNTATLFALNQFEVHLIDLRSFGYSGGARCGHSMQEFQEDVLLMLRQVNPELPCFLIGHSLGGLILTTILINNPDLPIAGAIISAPAYESSSAQIDSVKFFFMKKVSEALKEGVFNSYIAFSSLSRDDDFIRRLHNDNTLIPFCGPELMISIVAHMRKIMRFAHRIKHPIVFFHGDADILTSPDATEKVFRVVQSPDKQLVLIPKAYHEAHHDLERDKVIYEMVQWASCRIRDYKFGLIKNLAIGEPGLEDGKNYKCWIVLALAIILYLIAAWKLKKKTVTNFSRLKTLVNILGKIFWPISLMLS